MRDLPAALADKDWTATILTPSYGMFHRLPGAKRIGAVRVLFRGKDEDVDVYDVPGSEPQVQNLAFEHPLFSPHGPGRVYCSDEPERPFATDSNKFAFFAAATATWIDQLDAMPDVVHLHDWHAATYAVLREFGSDYRQLRNIRTVFTIHNLSYQGVRPLSGDESALESWFPGLHYSHSALGDPFYPECYNPMAAAIRLTDKISTVSPTYANEICEPSDPATGFIGGEGLETELIKAKQQGRLVGVLNGCFYNGPKGRRPGWQRILNIASEQVEAWAAADPDNAMHKLAQERLASLPKRRPKHVLTSVGRLVRQKAALLFEKLPDGRTALDAILDDLGSQGVLILLGSGEKPFEQQMLDVAKRHDNVLFLCGYSESLADPLYRAGDLFLMPSSFEPCGISQMLAMRATQPCVVHGVGGLKDTVKDDRSGFVFNGSTPTEQATAFVDSVVRAVELKSTHNDAWQKICIRAASARFSWSESAQQTIELLYDNA
ncbi:MAG: glycosyltransferase [Woeseiaceae bacterium]|nr:glycosyltransferase [Woeseiaceae bacterium]